MVEARGNQHKNQSKGFETVHETLQSSDMSLVDGVRGGLDFPRTELTASFQEMKQLNQSIEDVNSGFKSVGDTIHTKVTGEIQKSDGIFDEFVSSVLSGIEQISGKLAAEAIFAGVLSFVTGGTFGELLGTVTGTTKSKVTTGGILSEAISGNGVTARRRNFEGATGAEQLQSLTSFGRHAEPLVIQVSGTFKSSGRDLMSTFKEARIIDRKLGGAF